MVEIPDVGFRGSEPVRFVDDELRFVVQAFDRSVVDRHPEVVEDVIFVATHHPCEVAHRGKSGMGCVSRVAPVQTALRNCTRDEGGPFGFGRQGLIPSYRKLLWSKAMVVSVAEKSGR